MAVDPLTAHECGNQRYLAIPWLDACLTARLPKTIGEPLKAMPVDKAWLGLILGGVAAQEVKQQGDLLRKAAWLPNEAIAKAWMEYVKDTKVSDTTPPPPSNVRVQGNKLTWETEADLESGLATFIVKRAIVNSSPMFPIKARTRLADRSFKICNTAIHPRSRSR